MQALEGPHDERLEAEVLGAILVVPERMATVAGIIDDRAWHHPAHGLIWGAMRGAWQAGEPLDLATIAARLRASGDYERAGGMGALMAILDRVGLAAHVEAYAERLAGMARARRVVGEALRIAAEGSAQDLEEPDAYCADAASSMMAVAAGAGNGGIVGAAEGARLALDSIAAGGAVSAITTGLGFFDSALSGVARGRMTVIAGRPGMGKTALALSLVAGLCARGARCHVISLEMGAAEVYGRILAIVSGLYVGAIVRGDLTPAQHAAAMGAAEIVARWALTVDDRPGLSAGQCVASVEGVAAREGAVDVAVVDHFHLLAHRRERGQRTDDAMGRSSGVLRDAAKRGHWGLLLAAQLNRASERDGRRPTMADIREAGALEQDAYAIVAPWRDVRAEGEAAKAAELLVLKQRNGPTGAYQMRWSPRQARYEDG